jgi:carboxymethylenebutenolidase
LTSNVTAEEQRLGSLRIHVARPQSDSKVGALLYPTIFGLEDSMRGFARSIADAGVTAVVWDPYDGEDSTSDAKEMLARSKDREDAEVVRDLKAIVDHMEGELDLPDIAAVGWCFGGRLALVHAGSDDRVGTVCTYNPTMWSETPVAIGPFTQSRADFVGQTMDEFELAKAIGGPVQVCRPGSDFTQPAEYDRLIGALHSRNDPTVYEYYPKAEHGFSYTPGADNERAQRQSWATTLELLGRAGA